MTVVDFPLSLWPSSRSFMVLRFLRACLSALICSSICSLILRAWASRCSRCHRSLGVSLGGGAIATASGSGDSTSRAMMTLGKRGGCRKEVGGSALQVQEEIEEERHGRVMGTGEADDDARRQGLPGIQGRYHARGGPLNVAFISLSGNRSRRSVKSESVWVRACRLAHVLCNRNLALASPRLGLRTASVQVSSIATSGIFFRCSLERTWQFWLGMIGPAESTAAAILVG